MRIAKIIIALAAATLVATGCANQKEPAEKALAQSETSLMEIRGDAEKFAREELQPVEETLTKLRGALQKKDYKAVVLGAPGLNSSISSLKQTVAAKKADFEATMAAAQEEWTALSASVPQMVDAIQSRVDTLSKSRKLPGNLDKATFDSAKAGLETIKANWTEASAEFAAGNAANAVRKARTAKTKGEEVLKQLGMTPA